MRTEYDVKLGIYFVWPLLTTCFNEPRWLEVLYHSSKLNALLITMENWLIFIACHDQVQISPYQNRCASLVALEDFVLGSPFAKPNALNSENHNSYKQSMKNIWNWLRISSYIRTLPDLTSLCRLDWHYYSSEGISYFIYLTMHLWNATYFNP